MVTRAIQSAQSQVEARNAEIRKNVLKYDDVLDRQRKAIYGDRQQILDGEEIEPRIDAFRKQTIDAILDSHGHDGEWDFDALWSDLKQVYPIGITVDELLAEAGTNRVDRSFLRREILSDAEVVYRKREETLGEEAMRELERRVVLTTIDRRWRDHLYEMEYLKEGIGLRAMAQRDPLVEYQREGFNMFEGMMGQIKEESMGLLYNLEVKVRPAEGPQDHVHLEGGGLDEQQTPDQSKLSYSAPDEDGAPSTSGASPAKGRQKPAAQRGAFGQEVSDEEDPSAPTNRAERRANKKK